jgi:hypothetical protein
MRKNIQRIFKLVQEWWEGEPYTPVNDPVSKVVIIDTGRRIKPKIRVFCEKVIFSHWQFWIGTTIAVVGLSHS